MAGQLEREWTELDKFPYASREKVFEMFAKLRKQNAYTVTILVMGKGGVGKSSTINSIIGERVVPAGAFMSETPRPVLVSRSRLRLGIILNIIDTPGLVDGGYINEQVLDATKRVLKGKTIDVLLYVDRLDSYRVDDLDKQVVKAITDSFGKEIWHKAVVVLTHAQFSPPDALGFEEFFYNRSESVLKCVCEGARMSKKDVHEFSIPVALVENSWRCKKNEQDEKVLPNGTPWIPNILSTITDIALNGKRGILIDQKLIDGPNANDRGRVFIPLILAFQYFFVINPIRRQIKNDVAR
ncbi:translocon at the outer envelope membrane ofchloroplasts 34 [Striga asiatica]|uniref:Translocon at the outer envelope membrane ofchloroplasts 34 n=1 Tax=Striga asiatica TaxID=4170 RepID=A0A5A7QZJ5_STRAF|nr:translocon at the outer envelope membrane ofchloroplasts 34 [Striga asiatica]